MKKKLVRVIGYLLALVMIFSITCTPVYASEKGNKNEIQNWKAITDNIKSKEEYKTKDLAITVVTDQNEMKKLMEIFDAVAPEGKTIQKIELCESLSNTVAEDTAVAPYQGITPQFVYWGMYIKSTTDRGTGWYFPDSPYMDNWWQGPDTAVISQTSSISATANTSLGVKASDITASVGFSVTGSYSVTLSSTTPVPAGKTLEVKTYITYQKVDYDVWYDVVIDPDEYYATGSAYKPLGSYFAKFWY
jgi:hypothetical protein